MISASDKNLRHFRTKRRFNFWLVASFVVSCSFCQTSMGNDPEITTRGKANEGLKLYSSGKFSEAAQAFELAADKASDNSSDVSILQFNQACALRALGDESKAKELFLAAATGQNQQVASSAQFNLALMASDEAKLRLGDDPLKLPAEERKFVVELLNSSVSHFRDSLRTNPNNSDARHNLELLRLFIQDLEEGWQASDKQKERDGKDLFQFLEILDQQLNEVSVETFSMNSRKSKVSRLQRSILAEIQKDLLDEFEPLKGKLQSALQPTTAETDKQNLTQEEQARIQQIQELLNELVGRSQQSISSAESSTRSGEFAEAMKHQESARDRLNELFVGLAPFQQLLQRAIADQEFLLGLHAQSLQATPPKNSKGQQIDFTGQAWIQDWISQFSLALSPRASSMLQSMPQPSEAGGLKLDLDTDLPDEPTSPEAPGLSSDNIGSQESAASSGEAATSTAEPAVDSTSQSAESTEEALTALRRALEKAIESSPEIASHSNRAKDGLSEANRSLAETEQREVLRLLKEIADLLPKQPQQDKPQDQQNSDQQQDKNQQQKNEKDKPQDSPKQNDADSKDSEQSKSSDQQEPEKQQPEKADPKDSKDKPDQMKEDSSDKKEEQSSSSKTESKSSEAKQGTEKEQPGDQVLQRKLAEERAQTLLRRIREREVKYRELLEQLREIQARQQPVEKDW